MDILWALGAGGLIYFIAAEIITAAACRPIRRRGAR
jgi:hypothetical protein